jgi:hypothetical protein
MEWLTAVFGFVGTALGAGVTLLATTRAERRRAEAEARARWEQSLYRLSSDLAATTRNLIHIARQFEHADHARRHERIDEHLQRIRVVAEELRLVGNLRVQVAARMVRRQAWPLKNAAEAADLEKYRVCRTLVNDALRDFYVAVREQLGLDPEEVIHDDASEWYPGEPVG